MDILLRKVNNIFINNNSYDIQLGVKLPPYFDEMHFIEVANIINKYNIKFITCINSLGNGLVVDIKEESTVIHPKSGFGGIGGKCIKPIALANVRKFSKLTNCDVIGCGGISSGQDAFEHILCGAKAIQVGTQLYMEGVNVFKRIIKELETIILSKGYSNLNDFCGKLKEI
jgi:dihydroorotate dehydrogenase (fumarate)